MEKKITIYHGSDHIIENPSYGFGRKHNDFGLAFYCTQSNELAKEWAVSSINDGFSNKYTLDVEHLNVLNINSCEYSILNWIAILLEHRLFTINNPIANKAKKYLIENFGVNVNAYDVIIGYRADDSYFDFAETFINNGISVDQLAKAMSLGNHGEQIVIKSKYAFSKLTFEDYEIAEKNIYYTKRKSRDDMANKNYIKILEEDNYDGLYIRDIIRGEVTNEDPRIPKNIS